MSTYTVYKDIIKQLNEIFAPLDEAFINDTITSAFDRKKAMKKYKNRDDIRSNDSLGRGRLLIPYEQYMNDLFQIAGGKGWYDRLANYGDKDITSYAEKKAKSTIESRNAKIAKKLADAEITSITKSDLQTTSDGFNGVYKVETAKGPKTITITTIGAGGYHIQCYHLRVLVKIK